jgi:hypothetical protein
VLYYAGNPAVKELNLNEFIGLVGQASPLLRQQYGEGGPEVTTYPTNQFFMNVDTAAFKKLNLIPKGREKHLVSRLDWSMGKRLIEKKNLVILDMIATNNWQRPIYFSSTINPSDYMSLQPYFQLEGMAYRLLPLKDPQLRPPAATRASWTWTRITRSCSKPSATAACRIRIFSTTKTTCASRPTTTTSSPASPRPTSTPASPSKPAKWPPSAWS